MRVRVAEPSVVVEKRGLDTFARSGHALPAYARCVGDWLVHWAKETPQRVFLAERALDGSWRTLTYAEALRHVESVASSWLDLGLSSTKPVMIVVDNGIDHAIAAFAAMHVGIPASPVSTAYALASTDFGRLKDVARTLQPGAIVVGDRARYGKAIEALRAVAPSAHVVSADELDVAHARHARLDDAFAAITHDTIAKVLFTSGSTGSPKGVVNTQRMLTSNQAMIAALWPFLDDEPPITVDWLPWSHTFGGNHNLHMILRNGGTLYVDEGRPAPGLVEKTARNLKDVAPTIYFNVPRGFDLLLPFLENDDALRAHFFSRLGVLFYAAAALPPKTRARLEAVAKKAGREDVFVTSAWGSTETAPLATSAHFATSTPAVIGLPAPGVDIKLADVGGDKREIRVKGPNVTPGSWSAGGVVERAAFDGDGFLPTGDAAAFVDENEPAQGIVFQGRLGENFKLSSGTWVSVGQLRIMLIDACAPLVQDLVVAGHDRDALGVLLFLSPATRGAAVDELKTRLLTQLREHNARNPASSHRIARADPRGARVDRCGRDHGQGLPQPATRARSARAARRQAVRAGLRRRRHFAFLSFGSGNASLHGAGTKMR